MAHPSMRKTLYRRPTLWRHGDGGQRRHEPMVSVRSDILELTIAGASDAIEWKMELLPRRQRDVIRDARKQSLWKEIL
jgi:hypothetical protein